MRPLDDLDALKARVRLSDHVSKHVKLSKVGADHWGLCPFHNEKSRSFSVNDAKGFFHCFGCNAHGDILDWWRDAEGLSFDEGRERLRREAGVLPIRQEPASRQADRREFAPRSIDRHERAPGPVEKDRETLRKQAEARAIWAASEPIIGTIAETYLRQARGIDLSLPDCLRFHPRLAVGPRELGDAPAMVAAVTDLGGGVVAIQRTFLLPDGSGKALFERPKRALGPVGEGAVCLAPAGLVMGIAEGIETGLSAMEMFAIPVWCALGSNLSRLILPDFARNIALFADRGEAGERAAVIATRAYHEQKRRVTVRFSNIGNDFNDELRARRNGL